MEEKHCAQTAAGLTANQPTISSTPVLVDKRPPKNHKTMGNKLVLDVKEVFARPGVILEVESSTYGWVLGVSQGNATVTKAGGFEVTIDVPTRVVITKSKNTAYPLSVTVKSNKKTTIVAQPGTAGGAPGSTPHVAPPPTNQPHKHAVPVPAHRDPYWLLPSRHDTHLCHQWLGQRDRNPIKQHCAA